MPPRAQTPHQAVALSSVDSSRALRSTATPDSTFMQLPTVTATAQQPKRKREATKSEVDMADEGADIPLLEEHLPLTLGTGKKMGNKRQKAGTAGQREEGWALTGTAPQVEGVLAAGDEENKEGVGQQRRCHDGHALDDLRT